jgi:hypothetical protein
MMLTACVHLIHWLDEIGWAGQHVGVAFGNRAVLVSRLEIGG